jgi:cytochrome b6-f complex iron-sulfur subunit
MSTVPPNPPAAAGAAAKKPLAPGAPPEGQYTRRDFLTLLGWGWLATALGGWLAAALRFMFPNMLYEPNPTFKAGKPSEYPLVDGHGAVYTNWQAAQRVWIMSNPEGIYAFEAKCTHLGCTPRWEAASAESIAQSAAEASKKGEQPIALLGRFKCPCHGSNFDIEGDVVAGPAPKPLWRLNVALSQDGQLVINKADRTGQKTDRRAAKYFLSRSKFS